MLEEVEAEEEDANIPILSALPGNATNKLHRDFGG